MTAAHDLFHADSRQILDYLATPDTEPLSRRRREVSILLCAGLMRAAGQDRYEQGDIWAKVADHRPTPSTAQPDQWQTLKAAARRLATANTGPRTPLRTGWLASIGDWLAAFEKAGRTLSTRPPKGASAGESGPSPPTTSSSTGTASA